jgi:hypothetical protein
MANFSPTAAFTTRKPQNRLAAFALGCVVASAPITLAASDTGIVLKPYTASYITTARGLNVTLERKLARKADESYELTNGGSKMLVVGFQEVSNFRIENSRVIPGSYVYQGTGLMNRRREVKFTPGSDTIRSLYKDTWYDLPYTENTFDRMSQQEQIRLLLLQDETPKETVVVTVADGKRVKEYRLDFVAEEILDTPIGPIKTLHFERLHDNPDRKSDTWLAPAWDYMMVKTVHVEHGKPVVVKLTKASIDGVALKVSH